MKFVQLGELIQPAKNIKAGQSSFPVLSMTMHEGLVLQSGRFKKKISSQDLSQYKVVQRQQLVVGFPIDEGVLDFQTVVDSGIVSPAYGVWDLISSKVVDPGYLGKFLKSPIALSYYKTKLRGTTARRRSLPRNIFEELLVPLPPLEEQKRIAKILDTAAKTKEKAYTALKRLDASRTNAVNECLKNENSQKRPLSDFTDIRSGITKGRKVPTDTKLSSIPYLAVSNVKDGYLDLDVVKTIDVTPREAEKFSLSYGDILLTEGGDPDKLGRGTVWKDEIENCIHQNHVFRVRLETDSPLTPQVLMAILSSNPLRSYFFRSAKQTTGIASINRTQLAAAPIPILSSTQVAKLDSILTSFDQVQALLKQRIKSLEELQNSLQTRAFQGLL